MGVGAGDAERRSVCCENEYVLVLSGLWTWLRSSPLGLSSGWRMRQPGPCCPTLLVGQARGRWLLDHPRR